MMVYHLYVFVFLFLLMFYDFLLNSYAYSSLVRLYNIYMNCISIFRINATYSYITFASAFYTICIVD